MKFDVNILRYIEKDAWRVLVSVEMGMKNHELVPVELINAISGLKHGGAYKLVRELLKHKLVHHENQKYDGYRLTPLGYDFLAIKAFVNRGAIAGVGRRIGVGKESDVFEVVTADGETLALKLHRLGRTSFRAVKSKRDYIKATTTHTNWLYLSRLAALKEHAFMKALGDNGFPVPKAVDVNRHAVLMSLVDGAPLTRRYRLEQPGCVYAQCVTQLVNLAKCGLVHCDYNEFNIMCNDSHEITVIDFPQMVSTNHPNAEDLFQRDLHCLHKFFLRRYDYRASEDPDGMADPNFFDVAVGGVGHGKGEGVEKSLDVSLRASGFTAAAGKDLDAYNALRITQNEAEHGGSDGEEEGEDDDDDDDSDSSQEELEGQRGGDPTSRFGYVDRGEESVEEGSDEEGDDDEEEEEDVENDVENDAEAAYAAEAALARLYGGGSGSKSSLNGGASSSKSSLNCGVSSSKPSVPTIDENEVVDDADDLRDDDGEDGSSDESEEPYDEGEGRRSKKWVRAAEEEAKAVAERLKRAERAERMSERAASQAGGDDTRSVGGASSMRSTMSRADIGNDPDLVRQKLKRQSANAKSSFSSTKPAGTRNHTKDRGGNKRGGMKGHQFKYDGYGGQATL